MSSVIERGHAVARAILDRRDPYGSTPLDHDFIRTLLAEAFAQGAMWGITRCQHAVALTHARYAVEIERGAP